MMEMNSDSKFIRIFQNVLGWLCLAYILLSSSSIAVANDLLFEYKGIIYQVIDENTCRTNPGFQKYVNDDILFEDYSGNDATGDIVIPSKAYWADKEYIVTEIGDRSFYNNALQSIVLPETLKRIGEKAFQYTPLKSIKFPESLEEIGSYAFDASSLEGTLDCSMIKIFLPHCFSKTRIKSVILPENSNLSDGSDWASSLFSHCQQLESVSLPSNMKSLPDLMFSDCKALKNIELPEGLEKIGSWCFAHCESLTEMNLPSTVTYIGEECFTCCVNLKNLNLNVNIETIKYETFKNCIRLEKVIFPKNLKEIQTSAFAHCNLKEIILPKGLTYIGDRCFENIKNLTSLFIPASVEEIGDYAWRGCNNIRSIYYPAVNPHNFGEPYFIYTNFFPPEIYDTATLYVPEEAVTNLEDTDPWGLFKNVKASEVGVQEINGTALDDEIFNIFGLPVKEPKDCLSPGIYIINGKKVVISR